MSAPSFIEDVAEGLLQTTLQASVLILVVLILQWLLSGRLNATWRFSLWWLVLIRLMLPITPESSLSLFNHVPTHFAGARPEVPATTPAAHSIVTQDPLPSRNETTALASKPDLTVDTPIAAKHPAPTQSPPPQQIQPSQPAKPTSTPTLREILTPAVVMLWALGCLTLMGAGMVRSVQMSRLIKQNPLTRLPECEPLLEECRSALQVRTKLELAESPAISNPLVYGFLRPRLLLPTGLSQTFSPAELRHVFLHELAHIKRGDLLLNWLIYLLQAVHWFNPVVWLGLQRLQADRESVCDEIALTCSKDSNPVGYGRTLLKLLERLPQRTTSPGMVGIMEDANQVKRRMNLIVSFKKQKRRTGLLAIPLLVGLGVATLTDAKDQIAVSEENKETSATEESKNNPPPRPENTRLALLVVSSSTGEGIPNASVKANYFYVGNGMEGHDLTTDSDGRVFVPEPTNPTRGRRMNFWVTAPSYVPKVVAWNEDSILPNYTLRLDPATTIRGTVVDENNQPVENVKIRVQHHRDGEPQLEEIAFHPRLSLVSSDAEGQWSCPYIPKDFQEVTLRLTHPDYAATRVTIPISSETTATHRVVIQRGWDIHGIVRDWQGHPLADAEVREVHNYGYEKRSTRTAKDGSYSLKGLVKRDAMIVVQAEQFAPALKDVAPISDNVRVDIRLSKSRVFHGTVVDESGTPIEGAAVLTDTDDQGLRKVHWKTKTDNNGQFRWESAPAEPLLFWFEAKGYQWIRDRELSALDSPHRIVLKRKTENVDPSIRVRGRVVDAESGEDIPNFKVLIGETTDRLFAPTYSRPVANGTSGRFETTIKPPLFFREYHVLIQADGYLPAASKLLTTEAKERELYFSIIRGTGPSGRVLFPDGEPVNEAEVYRIGFGVGLYMDQPGEVRKEVTGAQYKTTTMDGHFEFEPSIDTHSIIVVHPKGYANVTPNELEENNIITLSRYAEVEGILLVNGSPAPGETVYIRSPNYRYKWNGRLNNPVGLRLSETTDEHGRFRFDKVPPGERIVCHRMSFRDRKRGTIPLTHGQLHRLEPGNTTRVQLGGTGRPIIGKLRTPDYFNRNVDWQQDVHKLVSDDLSDPKSLTRPKRDNYPTSESFFEASRIFALRHRSYWMSEEGRARSRNRREYVPLVANDGSFRISDVPPGNYTLQISITESQKDRIGATQIGPPRPGLRNKAVGTLTMNVTVPAPEGIYSNKPLDLGELTLE